MKAIILAAGASRRFGDYLRGKPKSTLQLGGRTLLQHQVSNLRAGGVDDFVVVKGYHPEDIVVPDSRCYLNPAFASTNMVHSLFCAVPEIEGEVIIAYADIVYETGIIEKLRTCDKAIAVAADRKWADYYGQRYADALAEAESFVIRNDGAIAEIGASKPPRESVHAQYMGLIRLNAEGARTFRRAYDKFRAKFYKKLWIRNRVFESAYMTDFLQALIDDGESVYPVLVEGGWLEFDSPEDY